MKTVNIHYRPQLSWGKVIFSQASVILSTGGCAWLPGGVHGCRGHAWLPGACMVAREGACMAKGGGACVGYDEIRSMSGRYASYWNAFLLFLFLFFFSKLPELQFGGPHICLIAIWLITLKHSKRNLKYSEYTCFDDIDFWANRLVVIYCERYLTRVIRISSIHFSHI